MKKNAKMQDICSTETKTAAASLSFWGQILLANNVDPVRCIWSESALFAYDFFYGFPGKNGLNLEPSFLDLNLQKR